MAFENDTQSRAALPEEVKLQEVYDKTSKAAEQLEKVNQQLSEGDGMVADTLFLQAKLEEARGNHDAFMEQTKQEIAERQNHLDSLNKDIDKAIIISKGYANNVTGLSGTIENLTNAVDTLVEKKKRLEAEVIAAEDNHTVFLNDIQKEELEKKAVISDLENKISTHTTDVSGLVAQKTELQLSLNVLKQDIQTHTDAREKASSERTTAEIELDAVRKQHADLIIDMAQKQSDFDSKNSVASATLTERETALQYKEAQIKAREENIETMRQRLQLVHGKPINL